MATAELVCSFLLRLDDSGELLGLGSHYGIYGRLYVCDFARRLREATKLVFERMNLFAKLLAYGLLVFRRLLVLSRDARRGGKHFLEFPHASLVDYDFLDDLLDRNLLDYFLLYDLLDFDGNFLDDFLFHYLLDRNLDDLLDNLLNGHFDDLLDDLWLGFDLRRDDLRLWLWLRRRFRLWLGIELWHRLRLRRSLGLWLRLGLELYARRGRIERLARLDHRRRRRETSARNQRLSGCTVEWSARIAVANVY